MSYIVEKNRSNRLRNATQSKECCLLSVSAAINQDLTGKGKPIQSKASRKAFHTTLQIATKY